MKIRENGCIDIFTATNQGIRIDPNYHTINLMTANELHHISRYQAWVDGTVRWDVHEEFDVICDSDISMYSKKDWLVSVIGKATINAHDDIELNTNKSIRMHAGDDMYFDAKTYRFK